MAINKVVDRNNNILIDLTNDTVKPNKVFEGIQFHDNEGKLKVGTFHHDESDIEKYTFIDYDGEVLYSFTDSELDALTELPPGPVHSDEPILFEEWNWTLEDLKSWNRNRETRPIVGANYRTVDGKSYIYFDVPFSNAYFSFSKSGTLNSVDWGDGTIDTNTSHTYSAPGEYIVKIDMAETGSWYLGSQGSGGDKGSKFWFKKIYVGNISEIGQNAFAYSLASGITIPAHITSFKTQIADYCYNLKSLVIPKNVTSIADRSFRSCRSLKIISLPKNLEKIGSSTSSAEVFSSSGLEKIVLPDSLTSILSGVFSGCKLKSIEIPINVKSIGETSFNGNYTLIKVNFVEGCICETISSGAFSSCSLLSTVELSNNITSIKSSAFSYCYLLKFLTIPDSVTSLGSYPLASYNGILDLSQQTKVITLSSSTINNTYGPIIRIPTSLLEEYKSASYWSALADYMIGV